jgi:hypothetical protein
MNNGLWIMNSFISNRSSGFVIRKDGAADLQSAFASIMPACGKRIINPQLPGFGLQIQNSTCI